MRIVFLGFFLISVFFFRQIFTGEVWYCCDNLLINIPARVFQKEFGFADTNPFIFSGSLFFADINLAAFYPGNIIFWLIKDPFRALTLAIIIHFFIAFTGMYLLAGLLAAVIYTFSGTLVTYTNNLPMLQVAALLPWVFWAWNKNLVFFVLLASIQIFAGHAQFMYYTWLLLIVWTLWFRPKNIWPRVFAILAVGLITSVQTMPFLQFTRESTRSTFGYEYAVFDSLNPLAIMRLLVPWSVGILNQGTAWAFGGSIYGYVGVVPLILALNAPRRKPIVRFFLVVAIVSFLLALGKYNPLYPILYKIVPGLGSFRSPQHYLLPWTFSVAVLAGYGKIRKVVVVAALCFLIIAFVSIPFSSLVVLNTAIAAIGLSLLYKFPKLVIMIVFVDLFIFTRSNIITLPKSTVSAWFAQSEALAKTVSGKIYVHKDLYKAPIQKQFGRFDWPEEAAWQVAILRPNINMLYHISSIDGYASMVSKDYQASFGLPATDPTGVNLGQITGEKLIERGVDTVLAPPDPKYIQELYPLELWQWQPTMAIYRVARK